MKVAIVHYWLNGMRGGEKVLESLCRLYPQADIYTHVYEPEKVSDLINSHTVHTSFISKLPFGKKKYQSYLPFMPIALEQLDLTGYDLVISSESGPAKGVITNPEAGQRKLLMTSSSSWNHLKVLQFLTSAFFLWNFKGIKNII